MKFLIDAQFPPKLCDILRAAGLDSVHIDSLPNGDETSDKEIASYADEQGLIVITKDTDFYHTHMLIGQPKKLLLVTTGNIKNRRLFDMIRLNSLKISNFFESCNYVELSDEGIFGHEF